MWLDIYEGFNELSKEEQLKLFNAMKQDLFPDEPDKIPNYSKVFVKPDLLRVWGVFIAVVPL